MLAWRSYGSFLKLILASFYFINNNITILTLTRILKLTMTIALIHTLKARPVKEKLPHYVIELTWRRIDGKQSVCVLCTHSNISPAAVLMVYVVYTLGHSGTTPESAARSEKSICLLQLKLYLFESRHLFNSWLVPPVLHVKISEFFFDFCVC